MSAMEFVIWAMVGYIFGGVVELVFDFIKSLIKRK